MGDDGTIEIVLDAGSSSKKEEEEESKQGSGRDPEYEAQIAGAFSIAQTLKSCEELSYLHLQVSSFYRLYGFVLWTCITMVGLLLGSERLADAILSADDDTREPAWLKYACGALEIAGGAAVAISARYNPDARKVEHRSLAKQYFALVQELDAELKVASPQMTPSKQKRFAKYDERYSALLKQSFDSTNYALYLTQTERRLTTVRRTGEYRVRQIRNREAMKSPAKLFSLEGFKHRFGLDSRGKKQISDARDSVEDERA